MSITFKQIPNNLRTIGVHAEFDSSLALQGLGVVTQKALIIAQKVASGTQAVDTIFLAQSLDKVKELAGRGSMASDCFDYFTRNNPNIETHIILVAEGTTAKQGTITITGTATESGEIALYLAGKSISVAVTSGDVNTVIASAINTAINADGDLLFTSSVASNVVTLTARNKGEWTNKLDISNNRYPISEGGTEKTPAGVTVAIVESSVAGAGNPSLATALSAIPDEVFNYILLPYNDASNRALINTEINDRQNALKQLEGHSFNAFAGTLGSSTTYGNTLNSQHNTTMACDQDSPSAEHQWASAYMGKVSKVSSADPALPYTGEVLEGIIPNPRSTRFDRDDRNTLLYNGIATHTVNGSGDVLIERGITNYQLNSLSAPDASFLDSQTSLTLSYLRQSFISVIGTRYQGFKIVSDPAVISAGNKTTSPLRIKGDIIAWGLDLVSAGIIEDIKTFKDSLVVERNNTDQNRVDVLMSPDLVNQLNLIATLIQFKL